MSQSTPDATTYRLPVDVALELPSGNTRLVEWVDGSETTLHVAAAEWPADVLLDPDHWLWATFVAEGGPPVPESPAPPAPAPDAGGGCGCRVGDEQRLRTASAGSSR